MQDHLHGREAIPVRGPRLRLHREGGGSQKETAGDLPGFHWPAQTEPPPEDPGEVANFAISDPELPRLFPGF